jgi:putative nucleotidyltransferase with HDIG domain
VAFAQRVQRAVGQIVPSGASAEDLPYVEASFGVASYPHDARTVSALLTHADAQLLLTKRSRSLEPAGTGRTSAAAAPAGGPFAVLDALVGAIDRRDGFTRRHSEEVSEIALAVAAELGFSSDTQRALRIAGLFHDVGKIGVPEEVLRKPGRLTAAEYAAVQEHATLGALIAGEVPGMPDVAAAIAAHHERYDGQGYPAGLAGEQIPAAGRILAVADAYSRRAATTRHGQPIDPLKLARSLRLVAGTELDPELVESLVRVVTERARAADHGIQAPER